MGYLEHQGIEYRVGMKNWGGQTSIGHDCIESLHRKLGLGGPCTALVLQALGSSSRSKSLSHP